MSVVQKLMTDELAYKIWRFLHDYPKKTLRQTDGGTIFETDFAALLDRVKEYSIIARSTDQIETAKGTRYPPDVMVNVRVLKDTFIVFECKTGKNIDIDVAAAFSAKVHSVAHKNELVIFRSGSVYPLRYTCRKLYRVFVSVRQPTKDALGFCWGNGIPVFYAAKLPVEVVPVKVVRYRLRRFSPSDSNQKEAKRYFLKKITEIDGKMFCEARVRPKDYRDLIKEVTDVINGVNTLINGRWT